MTTKMAMKKGLPGDFLFLDESGDLGLSKKSTPFLVIAILHLRSEDALKGPMRHVRKKLLSGFRGEMKWSNSSPEIRIAVMKAIVSAGDLVAGVSACAMRKEWISPEHARQEADLRYNYAARFALEKGGLFDPARKRKLVLTIDERNLRATQSMKGHLRVLREAGELCCDVDLRPGDSQRLSGLQAADFVAGAIGAACGREDWQYLNILKRGDIPVLIRQPGWKKKMRVKKMLAP